MKALLCIPTYNESGNVEPLYREIAALGLDIDVLFVDDASPDGTGEIIDRLARENPRLRAVHRVGKLGIGSAHLDCISYAYDHDYDVLVTMDCDFTHPPEYIPALIAKSENYDVVIGSRYIAANSLEQWTIGRRLLTYGGHFLTRYVLKLEHDASSGLRLYKLRNIPRDVFGLLNARGYSFFFESLYVLTINGFRIGEVGIRLPRRASGQSKMAVRDAAEGLFRLGRLWVTSARNPEKYRTANR